MFERTSGGIVVTYMLNGTHITISALFDRAVVRAVVVLSPCILLKRPFTVL